MNDEYFTNDQRVNTPTSAHKELAKDHDVPAFSYCFGGLLALIGAWFMFGIPLSLLALNLGRKGKEGGATLFGSLIIVCAWLGIFLSCLGLFVGA